MVTNFKCENIWGASNKNTLKYLIIIVILLVVLTKWNTHQEQKQKAYGLVSESCHKIVTPSRVHFLTAPEGRLR